jgi:hypothetical protein
MTGCAEWNSHPVVTEQNFGLSVKNMVKNQILYPEHGNNDNPMLGLDGQKARHLIDSYREGSASSLEEGKTPANFNVKKVGN